MTSTAPQILRARVALRERPLLDVLDLAVRFCAAHARPYAMLSLVVLVPGFALSYVAARAGGWWGGWIAAVAMTPFAEAPFVVLGSKLVFSSEVRIREVVRAVVRSVPSLLAVQTTKALALGTSALLCGLPWLVVSTVLLFVVEVLLLEQYRGVGATFARAQRIAGSRFGTALSAMLLLAAAPAAAAMVADVAGREVLGGMLELKTPASMFHEGGSWLALGGWWATLPMISTARFFVYLDVRTRSEGWDIQTRFASIAARADLQKRVRAGHSGRPHGAALLAMVLLAVPCDAHAGMDPSRARADVDGAMADNGYAFCKEPHEPLTSRARALCVHAREIPRCEGFAAACARAVPGGHPTRRPEKEPTSTFPRVSAVVGALARMAVWILVAAVLAAVLIPIMRAISRLRSQRLPATAPGPAKPDTDAPAVALPAETDENALLAAADDLARRGAGAAALELYLAASLRALGKRGALRLSRDRTNGEYLRQCTDGAAKPGLSTIVRDVDRAKFGGETPSMEVVSRAARHAAGIVRAIPLLLLGLGLAGTVGCGGHAGARVRRPADDPAGDELWFEVLRRQGVRAERVDTALASLPLPSPGQRSPAVVVDAERTQLDLETLDHLKAWVDAGGVLVLAGAPEWQGEFAHRRAASDGHKLTARRLLARTHETTDVAEPDEEDGPEFAESTEHAELASGAGFEATTTAEPVAWFDDQTPYAALATHGKGSILGIATDELMTNVGLARDGNAAAMLAIFSNADRAELRVAEEDDGVAPPSSPFVSLSRAGLGAGLVHALVASLILFLAVGVRLARARPSPPPRSRPFAEHVEAVGALYARARVAAHARAVYARFERQGALKTEEGKPKWTRQRFSTRSRG